MGSYDKTLVPSFVKIGRMIQRMKHRTDRQYVGHWQVAGYEKLYLLNPCVLLVDHSTTHHSPLTHDPVDPHLRKRRPRRLLPPNDRDNGIQEYVNGSSGTNIVWPWVESRCGRFCFDYKPG